MVGGTVSLTVIICTQVAELLQASTAVQVRVIVASQGIVPELTSAKVMTGLGSQLSVAVAEPVMAGVTALEQATAILGGHTIIGGTTSMVCISVAQVLTFPHQSVTVSVIGKTPQPCTTAGLTLMDCIWQLSKEPPSIMATVTGRVQLAFNS